VDDNEVYLVENATLAELHGIGESLRNDVLMSMRVTKFVRKGAEISKLIDSEI